MEKLSEFIKFKRKYPSTIAWRINKHASVIYEHLNPNEKITYGFVAQKGSSFSDLFFTTAVAITNKRLLVAQKRALFGYFLVSITPEMYNDLTVISGLFWGSIVIDTVKEKISLTYLSKKSLDEIETHITEFMMKQKQKYNSTK